MRKLLYIFFASLVLVSCNDDESDEPTLNLGYDYFPIEIGTFVEYRADSIWHDQPSPNIEGIHDTTSYYIREVIESEILDAQDEPSLRIVRFKRNTMSEDWNLVDVWFAKRTAQNAEKVEENVRYIKLAFPVRESAMWNLNALNAKEEWPTLYDSLFVEREMEDFIFPRTIRVLQRDNKNLIEDELAFEIYAEGVGLIKRYERDLTTQLNYINEPTAENIRLGHEFKWEIIDYGVE
ncbi:hypothetical protein O3Q51_13785 [Cryomorphaceae bacterium 1068]|nr:hypothetical protein [Cryomorphaceae bacterium 1068]